MHAVSNEKALVWREPEKLRGGGGEDTRKEGSKQMEEDRGIERQGWMEGFTDRWFIVILTICSVHQCV